MEKEITLKDIAGYVTEKHVCQMIVCLARNWTQGQLKEVSPADVLIDGHSFRVVKATSGKNEASAFMPPESFLNNSPSQDAEAGEVWTLGALAYYSMLGLDVFEGKGGATQTEQTPIPLVSSRHCQSALGALVRRCLSYLPADRPTMNELCEVAQELLEKPIPSSRRLTTKGGRSYGASLLSFWPEEMLPMVFLFVMFALPLGTAAQQLDQEMLELVKRCKALRSANNKTLVMHEFERDTQWTLMDELKIDRAGECTVNDPVESFSVNDICYRIAKNKGGVTTMGGRFRSGLDPRYHYSLIEVAVKKGTTVRYEIKGRLGEQRIAVAAFHPSAAFVVGITKDGQDFVGQSEKKDGVVCLSLKEKVKKGETFTLSITNQSEMNMPFVIINHNSRK